MSRRALLAAARLLVVAGLAVDAYAHFDLASTYAEAGGVINGGVLFTAEAVVALLAALVVAIYANRASYLAAFAVGASALAALIVSRYVDLGAIGPFPICTTRSGSARRHSRPSPRASRAWPRCSASFCEWCGEWPCA